MAIVWVPCDTCKGVKFWIINNKMVICTGCNGDGGQYRNV